MDDEAFKAAVMDRFDALDRHLETFGRRFDRVDNRLDAIRLRLGDPEERFDDLNRRMAALENGVGYVSKNTELALDRIRVLGRRIDNLENPESRNLP